MSDSPLDPRQNDARVDALRQQLRALGYLDAGVDRFVLGPAQAARRPMTIAALAAVRIGLLAGVLLGPAAALGIGARLPGLVTGTRDAIVVALYLAVLFGLAAALFSFVAAMVVTRLPIGSGRARAVSRGAGTLLGTVCLVYLTLWWRIANPDLASLSPLWTLFAIAVAVIISLLLGHATAIASFAVLVATSGQTPAALERPGAARRLTAAAAAVAFGGATLLLLVAGPEPQREASQPDLPVVSPGLRIRLLAIDGFDPAIVQPLRDEGRIPTLARIFARGVVQIVGEDLPDPARTWMTIATGQPPHVHGVEGLETRRVAGLQGSVPSSNEEGLARALRGATDLLQLTRPSTVSGAELRSKTVWEVAADAGLRAAVVNWWATWPAPTSDDNPPIVVSDRATLRLERGGELNAEIAPAELYERLQRQWPAIKAEATALVAALLPVSTDPHTAAVLRRSAEIDAIQLALASRLDAAALDFLALYLPGLDIAQHELLQAGTAAAPSALAVRLQGVRDYYVYLDALLRDAALAVPDELLVILTQPGRVSPAAQGLLAVTGSGAASSVASKGRAIDVAPTLLHALGLPISRELAGVPILGIFEPQIVTRYPVREVETYGQRATPSEWTDGNSLDREMLERLRSLGYVR